MTVRKRRRGRPLKGNTPRVLVTLRLEAGLLQAVRRLARRQGVGYQTFLHEVIGRAISRRMRVKGER